MHPIRRAALFLLLLCLLAAMPALAASPEPDDRLDTFLDETAVKFGSNEAEIIQHQGQPKTRQTMPFSSPHDEAPYEVITLTYDGMSVSLYSMDNGQRQFLHQIRITDGQACFARGLCRGVSRDRLRAVLGEPEEPGEGKEDADTVWRYTDATGYNELAFTFDAGGAIDTMTWTAEAD